MLLFSSLVQTPGCIKITDFGLAKLLDINEEQYKASGGKVSTFQEFLFDCIY